MFEETSESSKTYITLPVNVFLEKIHKKWTSTYSYVEKELNLIESQGEKGSAYVSTVQGEKNIISFCRTLIRSAKEKIIISIWDPMYSEIVADLQTSIDRGCNVRGITFEVNNPINTLDNHRMNEYIVSFENKKWFIISIDSHKLLYGSSSEQNSNAFYTDDPIHVYLLEDYILHDVLVNRLVDKNNQQQIDSKIISDIEIFFGRPILSEN